MNKQISIWWEQALADLNSAKRNLEIGIYYISVLCSQQAVEKALKALYIKKFNKIPEKTHNLIKLGKNVGIEKRYLPALYDLNPEWIPVRYPDAINEAPVKYYDKDSAKIHLIKPRRL